MQTKHALYLTDVAIIFCDIDSEGLKEVFTYSLTDADYIEKLQGFLSQHQPESFGVYLDVMGEEFKHEPVPHIGGKDRELLLDRKCKGLFPSADLIWKKHLHREKKGRKDDVYLLIGVPLPSSVEHIFAALIQTKQMISGVYSLSILERDIHDLLPVSQQSLVVSRVLGSPEGKKMYRQTFFKEGELAMSRVTSINGETHEQIFPQLISEIERMHHFLAGTRQINNDLKLNVCTALGIQESEQLLLHQSDSGKINVVGVPLLGMAKSKGLNENHSFSSLAELLIAFSVAKKTKSHFKPEGLCASYKTIKTKQVLSWLAAGILTVSVCVGAVLGYTASVEKNKLDALTVELVQLDGHKETLARNAQVTEIEPVKMKQVVELYQEINTFQYNPDDVLTVLSHAYQGFGDVSLTQLSWLTQPQGRQNNRRRSGNEEPFLNTLRAARQFELKISLPSALGNRVILERVNDFSTALKNAPKIISVTREQAGLDTGANAQLAESLGGRESRKPVEFTLLITMDLS